MSMILDRVTDNAKPASQKYQLASPPSSPSTIEAPIVEPSSPIAVQSPPPPSPVPLATPPRSPSPLPVSPSLSSSVQQLTSAPFSPSILIACLCYYSQEFISSFRSKR